MDSRQHLPQLIQSALSSLIRISRYLPGFHAGFPIVHLIKIHMVSDLLAKTLPLSYIGFQALWCFRSLENWVRFRGLHVNQSIAITESNLSWNAPDMPLYDYRVSSVEKYHLQQKARFGRSRDSDSTFREQSED